MKYFQLFFYVLLTTISAVSQESPYMYNKHGEKVFFAENKEILYVKTNQETIKRLWTFSTNIDSIMPNTYKIKVNESDYFKYKELFSSTEDTYICKELSYKWIF